MGCKNKKYNIVYRTENLLNGKYYIGVHTTNKLKDNYLGSGKILKRAIDKHGKENFKKEILYKFDTIEKALEKEAELITEKETEKNICYNVIEGGGYPPTLYGKDNPMYGKERINNRGEKHIQSKKVIQFSEKGEFIKEYGSLGEALRCLNKNCFDSSISRACKKKVNRAFGYVWRYKEEINSIKEEEQRIKDFFNNYVNPRSKKVLQFDFNGKLINEWESVTNASKTLSIHSGEISKVCNNKATSAGEFIWRYKDNINSIDETSKEIVNYFNNYVDPKCKAIIQIDKKGSFIKEWTSITEAVNSTGYTMISAVCRGKRNTAGGYKWKYKESN